MLPLFSFMKYAIYKKKTGTTKWIRISRRYTDRRIIMLRYEQVSLFYSSILYRRYIVTICEANTWDNLDFYIIAAIITFCIVLLSLIF